VPTSPEKLPDDYRRTGKSGLVNNLNDGMSWGILPLFFTSYGLNIERIGMTAEALNLK
jgi:hypothetical protein